MSNDLWRLSPSHIVGLEHDEYEDPIFIELIKSPSHTVGLEHKRIGGAKNSLHLVSPSHTVGLEQILRLKQTEH